MSPVSPEDFTAGLGAAAVLLALVAIVMVVARVRAQRERRRRLAELQLRCVDVLSALRRLDDAAGRLVP